MAVDGSREVRVTRPDGSRVVVTSPRITPDSLVGTRGENHQGSVALPLSEVSRIAVRTPDREKNSALKLFAGVTAATFALWMALVVAGS